MAQADNPQVFRAYDIRGLYPDELNADFAYRLGLALGQMAHQAKVTCAVVGHDGRTSGDELSDALQCGIRACGIGITYLQVVTSPMLYFACQHLGAGLGVMVTGSHNPKAYNGFKMLCQGRTLYGADIQALAAAMDQVKAPFGIASGAYTHHNILPAYIAAVAARIAVPRPLKVVVDCGNGAAGVVAPQMLTHLGCEVVPLYVDLDPQFPNHHPDPSRPELLHDLQQAVRETHADFGVAFDGDGDRLGVVDNEGAILFNDHVAMLVVQDVLATAPGAPIQFDVKCSSHLAQVITAAGGTPQMVATGHALIKAALKKNQAPFAAEMSGHFYFGAPWFGFDDATYAAATLASILASSEVSLSALHAALPKMVSMPEASIYVADEEKFTLMQRLSQKAQQLQGQLTTIDGVRVEYPDGWALVRVSNTTPALVLRVEGQDKAAFTRICQRLGAWLQKVDARLVLPQMV